jgi:hypothetical protein
MPMRLSHRRLLTTVLAGACSLLLAGVALAATPAAASDKPAARPAAKATAKPAVNPATRPARQPTTKAKPAVSRQQANSRAKGLALATQTVEAISAGQLEVAARVLTGAADCEFKQRVTVEALAGLPGYFTVSHQGKRYRMLPRETTTGAVRLEDPDNGMMWLQIPAKSMLMNARRGQRLVDGCTHAEQRAAVSAATDAAESIGIVVPRYQADSGTVPGAQAASTAEPAAASQPVMPTAPTAPTEPTEPAAAVASATPDVPPAGPAPQPDAKP